MRTDKDTGKWMCCGERKKILQSFHFPNTPSQVEKQNGNKKIKLSPFLKLGLLKLLNPDATKGRFYICTSKARDFLKLPDSNIKIQTDWNTIGWIFASPRQRTVVLKVVNSDKQTSDEIMKIALKENQSVTRISTKTILSELISKELVETELKPELKKVIRGCPIYRKKKRRYYWLNGKGKDAQKDAEMIINNHSQNSD